MAISLVQAMKNPTQHRLGSKKGYRRMARGLTPGTHPANLCLPPSGTVDGTLHALQPPGGHPPVSFQWLAAHNSWFRLQPGANRIAFTAAYLSSHGWTYLKTAAGWH